MTYLSLSPYYYVTRLNCPPQTSSTYFMCMPFNYLSCLHDIFIMQFLFHKAFFSSLFLTSLLFPWSILLDQPYFLSPARKQFVLELVYSLPLPYLYSSYFTCLAFPISSLLTNSLIILQDLVCSISSIYAFSSSKPTEWHFITYISHLTITYYFVAALIWILLSTPTDI